MNFSSCAAVAGFIVRAWDAARPQLEMRLEGEPTYSSGLRARRSGSLPCNINRSVGQWRIRGHNLALQTRLLCDL